ncbi:MAG: phosphoribosyltransferase family protein [Thermodesulfovibrionales bacterium]|nr:phosphoribosyltransferase family protein [Thermodesulfovibrionales bacterium]
MDYLIENISLRDRTGVFEDRKEAGILLSEKLIKYKDSGAIVFAIPSGGVPVAAEIARSLNLSMELIIVRKIQVPYNPEAGFGSMDPDGNVLLNKELLSHLMLTDEEIEEQIKKTKEVISMRENLFRNARDYPPVKDKIVIIVDDGLASGYTMLSAIRFLKKRGPAKIIIAVPTGLDRTVERIKKEVDEIYCLNVRTGLSFAVADAYRNWYDLSDEEVINILKDLKYKR